MGCRIVVGGQYGSEGKGKVVALYSAEHSNPLVVRCGGPNSGHTISFQGKEMVLRQVPAGVVNPCSTLLLSAGCAINPSVLLGELSALGLSRDRVIVDPRAIIINKEDHASEAKNLFSIGSTASGTGSALVRRISRSGILELAGASKVLAKSVTIESVAPIVQGALQNGGDVIIEGTQGFGLSLLHGHDYPFVTSRDTTASAFASEVGISPLDVDHVTLVIRTFPIRVGGNSGPLPHEITWEDVQHSSGAPEPSPEYTSVTRRLRRVAKFDLDAVLVACAYNRPTSIAIMGIDRLDFSNTGVRDATLLTTNARQFILEIEARARVPVEWVGTGFSMFDAINLLRQLEVGNARDPSPKIAQAQG